MPLEIRAFLDRAVAVYLTGETLSVTVNVRNVSPRGRECLAWGSVQLSCERTEGAGPSRHNTQPTTAIAKSNTCVFSSRPSILFCDVELSSKEQQSFTCQIELPTQGLPPSFRGHLVRYYNRITVAVQHLKAPIKMVHIPIRIMPSVGLESRPSAPANPFLAETAPQPTVSEIVTAVVDQITAPRKEYVFQLTNSFGKVGTLTLFKKAFRLGEDVIGKFSFENSTVCCFHWAVHLETEEKLPEGEDTLEREQRSPRSSIVTHGLEHCVSAHCMDGCFRLSIPMSAPPTFHTDSVHVKWRLRFEFVTSTDMKGFSPSGSEAGGFGIWRAPENVPIETLTWQVDILVLPCSPHNAALTDSAHSTPTVLLI